MLFDAIFLGIAFSKMWRMNKLLLLYLLFRYCYCINGSCNWKIHGRKFSEAQRAFAELSDLLQSFSGISVERL